MKLKYGLVRAQTTLVFWIEEIAQCGIGEFQSKTGMEVVVSCQGTPVKLTKDKIVLTDTKNGLPCSYHCDSVTEAEKVKKTIHETLMDWSKNWNGFLKNKKQEEHEETKQKAINYLQELISKIRTAKFVKFKPKVESPNMYAFDHETDSVKQIDKDYWRGTISLEIIPERSESAINQTVIFTV